MEKKPLNLSEIQQISLEILKKVTDICEQNNFRYYLAYGTLIGAIRHEGFIPWDDDIDILMPRDDYTKLLLYWEKENNVIENLELFTHKSNRDYPYYIARISDNRYIMEADNEKPYGQGVFIDIYPYDGLGNDRAKADRLCIKGDILSSLCFQASRRRFSFETIRGHFRKVLKFPTFIVSKIVGKRHLLRKLDNLGDLGDFDTSEYVGCAAWNSRGAGIVQKREWFDEIEKVKFDKYYFNIPKGYNEILTLLYGDYMTLPPADERIGQHCYKIYKKQDTQEE